MLCAKYPFYKKKIVQIVYIKRKYKINLNYAFGCNWKELES